MIENHLVRAEPDFHDDTTGRCPDCDGEIRYIALGWFCPRCSDIAEAVSSELMRIAREQT